MSKIVTELCTSKATASGGQVVAYRYREETPARPDVGTEPLLEKRASPRPWRYVFSLPPALDCDTNNPAGEQCEALIEKIERHMPILRTRAEDLSSLIGENFDFPSLTEGGNRSDGEFQAGMQSAEDALKKRGALSKPLLNSSDKAEHPSCDVPALSLSMHKRLSVPFDAGDRGRIAARVIDDCCNELMVVKSLTEAA